MDYYHFNDITEINEINVINHIGENLKACNYTKNGCIFCVLKIKL